MRNLEIEGIEIPYSKLREVYKELESIFGEGLSEQINSLEGEIVALKVKLAMKEPVTNPWVAPVQPYTMPTEPIPRNTPILY